MKTRAETYNSLYKVIELSLINTFLLSDIQCIKYKMVIFPGGSRTKRTGQDEIQRSQTPTVWFPVFK